MAKTKKAIWLLIFASLIMALAGCATTKEAPKVAKADWKFHDIVDVKFVQQYAKFPRPKIRKNSPVIIQSRHFLNLNIIPITAIRTTSGDIYAPYSCQVQLKPESIGLKIY